MQDEGVLRLQHNVNRVLQDTMIWIRLRKLRGMKVVSYVNRSISAVEM